MSKTNRLIPVWLLRKAKTQSSVVLTLLVFVCAISLYFSRSAKVPAKPSTSHTNFPLILPHIEPDMSTEKSRQLYVAVVVNSAASGDRHRSLRMAIRKTWGNSTSSNFKESSNKWKLFFALGITDNNTENTRNLQEALQHNDVIIGNFEDRYENLAIKTSMGHYWVTSRLPSCKYVLKADDDVYVRVPTFIKWLEEVGWPKRFYGGYLRRHYEILRDPKNKWYISEEEFDELVWPPFCHGAFHVLSTDILPDYFHYVLYRRKPFHTDDAYLGVVARDLGVRAVQIPGFHLDFIVRIRSECELLHSVAIGHLLDVPTLMKYHSFYHSRNATGRTAVCLLPLK